MRCEFCEKDIGNHGYLVGESTSSFTISCRSCADWWGSINPQEVFLSGKNQYHHTMPYGPQILDDGRIKIYDRMTTEESYWSWCQEYLYIIMTKYAHMSVTPLLYYVQVEANGTQWKTWEDASVNRRYDIKNQKYI